MHNADVLDSAMPETSGATHPLRKKLPRHLKAGQANAGTCAAIRVMPTPAAPE
jgi:hypothetical protein